MTRMRPIGRRALLFGAFTCLVAACARAKPRPPATVAARPPDFDRWNQEAQGMLSDVLETLRTFDNFQAFRVSMTDGSNMRLAAELAWDPPTGAAWDEATHVTRGLHGRAEQLFQAVTTARLDPDLWRDQRDIADATHGLLDLSDRLSAYRERIDFLPSGDAAAALRLLDNSWAQWDTVAARWGASRAELLRCSA
jgi:hypothetical protein